MQNEKQKLSVCCGAEVQFLYNDKFSGYACEKCLKYCDTKPFIAQKEQVPLGDNTTHSDKIYFHKSTPAQEEHTAKAGRMCSVCGLVMEYDHSHPKAQEEKKECLDCKLYYGCNCSSPTQSVEEKCNHWNCNMENKKMTDHQWKEYQKYIKGFEDGYAMAKKIYKITHFYGTNENGETYQLRTKSNAKVVSASIARGK